MTSPALATKHRPLDQESPNPKLFPDSAGSFRPVCPAGQGGAYSAMATTAGSSPLFSLFGAFTSPFRGERAGTNEKKSVWLACLWLLLETVKSGGCKGARAQRRERAGGS